MTTDKELLEKAAKAAGIEIVGLVDKMIVQPDHKTGGFIIRNDRGGDSCWNPLTDDGDALRLAVKLGMYLLNDGKEIEAISQSHAKYIDGEHIAPWAWEKLEPDPYAATRRAIVRAAAAIGETT